jgi:hypothetical protein
MIPCAFPRISRICLKSFTRAAKGGGATFGCRDRRDHAAGRRINLLNAISGDLVQVPAVEGGSRVRGSATFPKACSSARPISPASNGSGCATGCATISKPYAYLLKEHFQQFWQYNSPTWAAKFLDDWCDQVMRLRIEPMKKIAKTLRGHRQLILNYFHAKEQFSSGVASRREAPHSTSSIARFRRSFEYGPGIDFPPANQYADGEFRSMPRRCESLRFYRVGIRSRFRD